MNNKKILFFAHDSSLYGASLSLLSILEHLAKEKSFELLVLLPYKGKIEERLNAIEVKYVVTTFPRCIIEPAISKKRKVLSFLFYNKSVKYNMPKLLEIANRFRPDLIYTNTSVISIGYELSKHLNVPHIWHIREFGDLGFNLRYLPSRNSIKNKIINSKASIYVSGALREHWDKNGQGNYNVVYNGIDQRNDLNLWKSFPENGFKMGMLGAIVPGKGQNIAIQALASITKDYPQTKLYIYGDVSDIAYYNSLQKMVKNYNLGDRVEFHAFVDDNSTIYNKLDIVISCSSNEGFGRTIIEAMSYGIPVIANASGGPLEIIDDGINGLLYQQTADRLAEKMIRLISDKTLYENISKSASEKVRNSFSLEKSMNQIVSLINDILKQ